MQPTNPEELVKAGLHFGHKTQRLHPRFRQYIYKIERSTAIIDVIKTAQELDRAKEFVYNLGKEKKPLLVVATKKPARAMVSELCKAHGLFYLTNKWIGGFFTNFEEIKKNIKRLTELKKEKETGDWGQFVKHERVKLEKKLAAVARLYEGVETMTGLPDALFIIDSKHEAVAVAEARKKAIPIAALVDTNGNPDLIDYPIPANDDAETSIRYVAEQIISAYEEGRRYVNDNKSEKTA